MNVTMNGALLCTRACAPAMKKRGGGAIVNLSSTAAWMGVGYYGLAKLAVNGLTQCLARELGQSTDHTRKHAADAIAGQAALEQ